MTNENGERLYMLVSQYYRKIDYMDFKKLYTLDPVKDFFQLNKIVGMIEDSHKNKDNKPLDKLQQNIDTFSGFVSNDYIYIPYAVALISRYPYIKAMERCLETYLKLSIDSSQPPEEMYRLLNHLIYEVPSPPPCKKLMFYIPYQTSPIEVCMNFNKNLPLTSYSLKVLLDYLSIDNIIQVHNLMLLEQKILFVANEYCLLSEVIEAFVNIMYPMQWVHTYIPVLSEDNIKYLQSFMPFLMGIEESMLDRAKCYLEEDNVFIFNIKKNTIEIMINKKIKKFNRKSSTKSIPQMLENNIDLLTSELKALKKVVDGRSIDTLNLYKVNKTIRSIFTKSMALLFGDYKSYVSYIDDVPLFNTESFLKNKPEKQKNFLNELTQTQNFQLFLQTKENYPFFDKICTRNNSTMVLRRESKKTLNRSSSVNKSELVRSNNASRLSSKTPNIVINKLMQSMDAYSDSHSKSGHVESRSFDYQEGYLITPYYIVDPILRANVSKIEEYIAEKYRCKISYNLFRC